MKGRIFDDKIGNRPKLITRYCGAGHYSEQVNAQTQVHSLLFHSQSPDSNLSRPGRDQAQDHRLYIRSDDG